MHIELLFLLLQLLQLCAAGSVEDRLREIERYYGIGSIGKREENGHSDSSHHGHIYKTRFEGVTWDQRNWRLHGTVLDQGHYQARGSIANGYLGINVASAGPFFEIDVPVDGDVINGWPLYSLRQTFASIAGFYDQQPETTGSNFPWLNQYGGESVISGVPHWSGLVLDLGDGVYLDATVDNSTISDYKTTYDFKAGVLSWQYTWTPKKENAGSFKIRYELFAHKLDINQAVVRLTVTPSQDGTASVVNVFDGYAAVRTDFVDKGVDGDAIYSAVSPWGVSNVTAYIYAMLDSKDEGVNLASAKLVEKPYVHTNDSSIAQAVDVEFKAGKKFTVTKYVGGASTDAFPDPRQTARNAALVAKATGFDELLRSHAAEWAYVMPDDSVDDFSLGNGKLPDDNFLIQSAITAVVNPYYLLQNTVGENAIQRVHGAPVNDWSIPVGGLTSDSYAGLIFWDADLWMLPGLVTSFPEAAKRITNYRVARYAQAKENVKMAFASSKNKTHFSESAAAYPWTSGRTGNCTGTGPCFDYQYHLNGDIGMALVFEYVASGDTETFEKTYRPMYDSFATLFADLLEKNGTKYTLTNMTDPDEYANHIDAGGYTMAQIAQTLNQANAFRKQFGLEENSTWKEMADNIQIIRENGVTLEYTTMNNSVTIKQADIVLMTFPLDYTTNYDTKAALNDLDYYALKQNADGPAMTYAIISIVANEVSPSGCSGYTYAQYSYDPYLRAPFFQMSEQMVDLWSKNRGTHPAYPFLTGHGGANQVVINGYLGLRLVPDEKIHIDPNLPPQVPHVKYRTFYWRGWPIQASSNSTHTTLKRALDVVPLRTADPKFANTEITVQVGPDSNNTDYTLPADGTPLVVPNRRIGYINTVEGNLVQCGSVHSVNAHKPGQYAISAIDGAASTKWQPEFANNVSSITVPLPKQKTQKKISGFHFDWAGAPPVNATVIFHDKFIKDPNINFPCSAADASVSAVYTFDVPITVPYDPDADIWTIELPKANTTNITLAEPIKAPRFATLFVQGNQAITEIERQLKNGTGPTVAEWAILEEGKANFGAEALKLEPVYTRSSGETFMGCN